MGCLETSCTMTSLGRVLAGRRQTRSQLSCCYFKHYSLLTLCRLQQVYHLSEACGWNCNLQISQRMGANVGADWADKSAVPSPGAVGSRRTAEGQCTCLFNRGLKLSLCECYRVSPSTTRNKEALLQQLLLDSYIYAVVVFQINLGASEYRNQV